MAEFRLPDLGEGVTEGEVIEWKVAAGDTVRRDQLLAVVGTDKATVEIPSPFEGTVQALLVTEGERVTVGQPLIAVAPSGASPEVAATVPRPADPPPAARPQVSQVSAASDAPRPPAMPSVRRAARLRGVRLEQLSGSGLGGRVRMEDLQEAPRREPLRGVRRVMAERMAEAHRYVPQVTVVLECDAAPLEGVLAAQGAGGASLLGLICVATVRSLAREPLFNASFDHAAMELVMHRGVDLGVAVQTEEGLKVVTLRAAEALAWDALQLELSRLIDLARTGRLTPAEAGIPSFTLSSGGRLGGLLATPLVNWPNVATLGVHQICDRALVRDGQVVAGRAFNLSLAFDHRVIDGMTASGFLYGLRDRLLVPEALLRPEARQGAGAETGS